MLRLVFTGHILAILTATVQAGEFLQPWTAATTGPPKDYSKNTEYAVGVSIKIEWVADFTNATIVLTQDNHPGDAQGGPSVTLEQSYNLTTWGWTVSYEGMDPAYNNVFYFTVMPNGSDGFTSTYFNISGAPATTESSATAVRSTGSNTSPSTAFFTTPASSGTMTPQSTASATVTVATVTVAPSSRGGTPAATIAGTVVGIVVGSLLLVGGAWWAWKIKKRRSTVASSQPYFSREQRRYEADGNLIHELHESAETDGNQIHKVHESAGRPIYELYGSVGKPRN